jgi:hypothetical protein
MIRGITGYRCRIDNLPTFTCSSPIVLDNDVFLIALGISGTGSTVHTFQVSATDIAGNNNTRSYTIEYNWTASCNATDYNTRDTNIF